MPARPGVGFQQERAARGFVVTSQLAHQPVEDRIAPGCSAAFIVLLHGWKNHGVKLGYGKFRLAICAKDS
jgi:hypothetical protein